MIQLLRLRDEASTEVEKARQPYVFAPFVFFCVLWPCFVMAFEALTGFAEDSGLDPFSTPAHVLACLGAPLGAFAYAWNRASTLGLYGLGFCLASSLAFTILMAPFLILGVMLAIVLLGLIPLAPVLSFLFSLGALRSLPSTPNRIGRSALGACCALALIGLGETPQWVARHMAETAESGQIPQYLRHWPGAAGALERTCTEANPRGLAFAWRRSNMGDPESERDNACRAHYLLTGQSTPVAPSSISLATSHQRIGRNPATGIDEMNWILEFTGDSGRDEEASVFLQLPRHTVLYGASLWIDGVERPAVFGGASDVTRAFENVAIRQRRDPILLNYAGEYRLHLRAFPISRTRPMRLRLRLARPASDSSFAPALDSHNLAGHAAPVVEWVTPRHAPSRAAFLDPYDSSRAFAWESAASASVAPLIYVIDHSAALDGQQPRIEAMLKRRPGKVYFTQGDQVAEPFRGGADNVPALLRAIQEAPEGARIVWLHGPQPHLFAQTYFLNRALSKNLTLHPLRLAAGFNAILNDLRPQANVIPLQDFEEAFLPQGQWIVTTPQPGMIASAAGAALWAAAQDPATAVRYRVVTKDVGAVVLERDVQYTQNGLEAPKEASGSEIPEPGTYALVASALLVLFWLKKKNAPAGGTPAHR
jgi:hypothetical protein